MTTEAVERKLTRADLMRAFWRYIFLFQCGWNYERMRRTAHHWRAYCAGRGRGHI